MRSESIHSGHRLGWPGLVVLALVPLLAVGTLLGLVRGSNNQGIQAAVVNHDKAVTVDGQIVPLGRQLASEMSPACCSGIVAACSRRVASIRSAICARCRTHMALSIRPS